jgi:hypothetical protein
MMRAADNAAIRSAIGVGTTDAPTFLAQTLTGQSLTGTQATSLVDLSATWNTTGTPSALKLNVTDTASNAASLLMDLQVGGVSKLSITKNGSLSTVGSLSSGSLSIGSAMVLSVSGGSIRASNGTAINLGSADSSSTDNFANLFLRSSAVISFGGDAKLFSDAAGILAQRNGTAAQAFRVANSVGALPLVDYDRGVFDFKTTTNTLRIGTENGGTYTTARPIEFVTGGVVRLTIGTTGSAIFVGAARFNSFFYIGAVNGVSIQSGGSATGVLLLQNNAQTGFDQLQLGGTTSAFPAIKRNGAGIDIRLADDSAFAPVKGKLTTDTAYTATVVAATGYITLYDSTGTAYRVPCAV